MDEYDHQGMDPELRRYFRKIMNSFSWGLMWMIAVATAGIFFKLAFPVSGMEWPNYAFYIIAVLTFALLIRYFYRTWK